MIHQLERMPDNSMSMKYCRPLFRGDAFFFSIMLTDRINLKKIQVKR
jgi:hypothetical protein